MVTINDTRPEDEEKRQQIARSTGRFIHLDPASSREQYRWMERFVASVEDPALRERLTLAIDGKGAFRRFKDVLLSYPVERDRWFSYRANLLHIYIDGWLANQDVVLGAYPPWGKPEDPPEPNIPLEKPTSERAGAVGDAAPDRARSHRSSARDRAAGRDRLSAVPARQAAFGPPRADHVIRPIELSLATSPARRFTRFIGVALGGGRGKTTAVARLERVEAEGDAPRVRLAEARLRHGHRGSGEEGGEGGGDPLFRDEVLVAYLQRWVSDDTVVAIDAPLTLPPCIRCPLACPGVQACTVPVVAWMRKHAPALHAARRSDPGKPAVTPYTQRAVDVLLTHVGLSPRESLGQGMGPLAARAAYLRRVLSPLLRLHENLIEVYPPATVTRLFGAEVEHRHRRSDSEQAWSCASGC
ncbi:UPF0158 family protein [Nannocystis pusilla]|uniref:UPF0158 family protein n=1 Tax=Nannocystis pusilla TaxID=889268 RepID=A0A9X3EK84_9BACT|nr:UPF0158 family protein [Nannocystis pusilla]